MLVKNSKCLSETGKYLDDYLDSFAEGGVCSDARKYIAGTEIPFAQQRQFESGELDEIDMHIVGFKGIYDCLPSARQVDFVAAAMAMGDAVVVDMGSMFFGAKFGLWVAAFNKASDVFIYNPSEETAEFPPVLFNERSKSKVFKFSQVVEMKPGNIEGSINSLYRANGIMNATFRKKAVDEAELGRLLAYANGRKLVLFSERTPTVPIEMTEPVARFVRDNKDAEMILAPLINTPINAYLDDPIIVKINKYHCIGGRQPSDRITNADGTPLARVFTAMQQYYAFKIAELSGRAEVYREAELSLGFPFHQPTHYVSTIPPKRK